MANVRWERVGAVCGIVFVVLIVVTFFLPVTPDVDDPVAEAIADLRADSDGLRANVYLNGLAAIAFLPFLGTLWTLLRRREQGCVLAAAALASGVITTAAVLITSGTILTLVEAAEENLGEEAVRALVALDNTLFIGTAFAFAAFYLAAGGAILATGALPRWLGWAAVVIGLVVVIGLLGVFSSEDDGGPLGVLVFLGFLLGLVWTLAASLVLLAAGRPAAEAAGAA